MSLNSTPGHTSSSSYESHDPSFTAEISAKMHVPDKISIFPDSERPEVGISQREDVKASMNVPDRILVAGDNKHIPARESLPELKYETPLPYTYQNYILKPPPDVLTVDDYPYYTVEVKPPSKSFERKKALFDQICDLNESSVSSVNVPGEENATLRKQIRHLSRRVLALEQENQQRQQREIIMYTLGITYFLIKGLFWLHRHF